MAEALVAAAPLSTVDTRIFAAALELLRTRGPRAVTMESVAAASGVAKTTIYRRFENRVALLGAVISAASAEVQIPDGLFTRDVLGWVLSHARQTIEDVIGRGTVAAVLANEDPEFTALLLGMIRTSIHPLRDDLQARSTAGELPAGLDIEVVISVLLGAVIAELIRGRPTDEAWAESVLDLIWPAFETGEVNRAAPSPG